MNNSFSGSFGLLFWRLKYYVRSVSVSGWMRVLRSALLLSLGSAAAGGIVLFPLPGYPGFVLSWGTSKAILHCFGCDFFFNIAKVAHVIAF